MARTDHTYGARKLSFTEEQLLHPHGQWQSRRLGTHRWENTYNSPPASAVLFYRRGAYFTYRLGITEYRWFYVTRK